MENKRIKVKTLGLGQTTDQGSFYAEVDGERVGANDQCFFEAYSDAYKCGLNFLEAKLYDEAKLKEARDAENMKRFKRGE